MTNDTLQNMVMLTDDDIIYVEKHGQQTVDSLAELKAEVIRLSAKLRANDTKVLLLVNGLDDSEDMDLLAWKAVYDIWRAASFDKCATYGIPQELRENRATVVKQLGLEMKIVDLEFEEEALDWLLG